MTTRLKVKYMVGVASDKQKWHLISALRGPDIESGPAKQFTIAIRRATFKIKPLESAPISMATTYHRGGFDVDRLLDGYMEAPEHWRNHMRKALRTASRLGILDSYGRTLWELVE